MQMSASQIPYALVDAFATGPFTGNQAAVIITREALPQALMQKIAAELNIAMTAFAVLKSPRNPSVYTIRWFTPDHEEELCGHATFATAHVLAGLPANSQLHAFAFESRSGPVTAERTEDGLIQLDFPADDLAMLARGEWEEIEKAALASLHGLARVRGVYRGRYDVTIEVIMNNGVRLDEVDVNHHALLGLSNRGVILTTETGNTTGPRFHSRFFCPGCALVEDTIGGSAHCFLGMIYAPRFNAIGRPLTATQGGPHRQGQITIIWDGRPGRDGGRMKLRGQAVTVAKGVLMV